MVLFQRRKCPLNEPSSSVSSQWDFLPWSRTPVIGCCSSLEEDGLCSDEEFSSKWANRGRPTPEEENSLKEPFYSSYSSYMTLSWVKGSFRGRFLLLSILLWRRTPCGWLFLLTGGGSPQQQPTTGRECTLNELDLREEDVRE